MSRTDRIKRPFKKRTIKSLIRRSLMMAIECTICGEILVIVSKTRSMLGRSDEKRRLWFRETRKVFARKLVVARQFLRLAPSRCIFREIQEERSFVLEKESRYLPPVFFCSCSQARTYQPGQNRKQRSFRRSNFAQFRF